jgi:hypothetical protein
MTDPAADGRHVHEQLGGFALRALGPDEDERVAAHLARCDECTDDYLEVADMLSLLTLASEDDVIDEPTSDEACVSERGVGPDAG